MLRAIILHKSLSKHSQAQYEHYYTIEFEAPEIEAALQSGGIGEDCYDIHTAVGIEIIATEPAQVSS